MSIAALPAAGLCCTAAAGSAFLCCGRLRDPTPAFGKACRWKTDPVPTRTNRDGGRGGRRGDAALQTCGMGQLSGQIISGRGPSFAVWVTGQLHRLLSKRSSVVGYTRCFRYASS